MLEKEYSLSIETRASYFIARVMGIQNLNAVMAVFNEIYNTALENNLPKVMIDIRELVGKLSLFECIFLITRGYHVLWSDQFSKVAVIDGIISASRERLIGSVVRIYGIKLQIFKTQLEALQWLAQD